MTASKTTIIDKHTDNLQLKCFFEFAFLFITPEKVSLTKPTGPAACAWRRYRQWPLCVHSTAHLAAR